MTIEHLYCSIIPFKYGYINKRKNLSKKIFRTDVKYGDIVTLTDYDMNSGGRLAFVLSVENNDYIEACLLSNLNEFATNYDVLIDNEFTGLGYTLIFQTNLI